MAQPTCRGLSNRLRVLEWVRSFHLLLKVYPAYKDKVEIKCMGSVGGKTPTEPILYSFLSILEHIIQDKLMLYVLFISNKGGKIRRLA